MGRYGGQTLLVELMPIPKHDIGAWGYEELIPQFKSWEDYYRQAKPRRLAYLQTLLHENKPQIVVGYRKCYCGEYKALFPRMRFTRLGQFDVGKSAGQTVVLTDHFTARSMNGKLDEVADILRG